MGNKSSKGAQAKERKQREKFDLTKLWGWDPDRVWVCDIEEQRGLPDCDFLFMATINDDGAADKISCNTGDRCVFQDVMYDTQDFIPDKSLDGRLDFTIRFGDNTAERRADAPDGWAVTFQGLIPEAPRRYSGRILTSWWGERPVKLMNYSTLTAKERRQYPDLMTSRYYKSMPR